MSGKIEELHSGQLEIKASPSRINQSPQIKRTTTQQM